MYKTNNIKINLINAKNFGLSPRTVLGQLSKNHFVIIKDRKSRIIMKDGRQLFEQVETIKRNAPEIKVSIATNAPICGKTTKCFAEKGISILELYK